MRKFYQDLRNKRVDLEEGSVKHFWSISIADITTQRLPPFSPETRFKEVDEVNVADRYWNLCRRPLSTKRVRSCSQECWAPSADDICSGSSGLDRSGGEGAYFH